MLKLIFGKINLFSIQFISIDSLNFHGSVDVCMLNMLCKVEEPEADRDQAES